MTAEHPARTEGVPAGPAPRMLAPRVRPCLRPAAVILVAGVLVPPAAIYARQYASVQALQFSVFATAAPALLVLGAPMRRPYRTGQYRAAPLARPGHAMRDAAARLAVFIALVIAWRLPGVLSALAQVPGLAAAEMATLVTAGTAVWLPLAGPPCSAARLARPGRAALAALSMWAIWVMAYIYGMTRTPSPGVSGTAAGRVLSSAADQQIAAAILWAVPAVCFMPVIYALVIPWLGDRDDPGQELSDDGLAADGPSGWPRPPRGWRSPR